ncbi:ATP-dependent DNA helicase [Cutibacterium modestum]|uniref:ATP-dependent DNA helicase n=1 Tax=Cutibacterium modestum TaxID=2559073 RepID=UPI0020A59F4D|nr:ATP-dependent DNA helicase [Cutibacterium modestum]MCP2378378.1 putative ATP-dependent helicase [Cutibacterium modestum 31N]
MATEPAEVSQMCRNLLSTAVSEMGGQERPGQVAMAEAVDQAMRDELHLLVQAGTGTGKSLGYLAPALVYCVEKEAQVIVATATLALQAQLAHKDIPAILDASEKILPRRPKVAVLKGRNNHICLHKVRGGSTRAKGQDALVPGANLAADAHEREVEAVPESALGAEVVMLREWAEEQAEESGLGDRDDAPPHTPLAWAQVSVPANECLGAQRCPFGSECLSEAAWEQARNADLVVTNHAMLAIDALNGGHVLPEHDTVIIDEAHELVNQFTRAASKDLSSAIVTTTVKRALTWLDDVVGADLLNQADVLARAMNATAPGRVTRPDAQVIQACTVLRDLARDAVSQLGRNDEDSKESVDAERMQAQAAMREVFETADRTVGLAAADVVWVSESEKGYRSIHVAPLSVGGLLRENVFAQSTTILTSATLCIGGSFLTTARGVGLSPREQVEGDAPEILETQMGWRGVDVGSPFDYSKQGILYVGRSLPRPGRDGIAPEALDDLAELVWAAGGRTLGLFSSQRSAVAAAAHMRSAMPDIRVLCQGEGHLADLTRRFTADPRTCLFGTVSLWQGVDIPGDTCRLVVIDRIPFPRPDDPLMAARSMAVEEAGGNGFMTVSAGHAALLLAQGAGRLIRRADDRGVVAVLDPRLVTARYGGFLRASMPSFWTTTDREMAVGALRRLGE